MAIGGSRGRHVRVLVSAGAPRSEKQSKKCTRLQRELDTVQTFASIAAILDKEKWRIRSEKCERGCSGSLIVMRATGGDETDWHGCAQCALECISDFAILLLPRKPSCRKKWCTDESGSFARNFSKRRSVWFFTFYNLLYSFAFLYSVV